MENLIFESKNRRHIVCSIYDCDDYYELRTSGKSSKFSKVNKALSAVIEHINLYGNPQSYPKSKVGFTFRKREKPCRSYQHVIHLSHVLFAAYNRKPITYYQGRRLCYIDGNENNLTKENIKLVSDSSASIMEIDGAKYTVLMTGGMLAITNYSENLHQIIASVTWQYDKKSKSMRSKTFNKSGCYLHQLVWVYFNNGATQEDWREKAAEIYSAQELTVDHKRAWGSHISKWDNRVENLQLMQLLLNQRKNNCTKKLLPHCFYFPVIGGEIYGRYDYENSVILVLKNLNEATTESVEALRLFCKTGDFQDETNIKTYDINSQNGLAILLSELHENKLYQEVLNRCLILKK